MEYKKTKPELPETAISTRFTQGSDVGVNYIVRSTIIYTKTRYFVLKIKVFRCLAVKKVLTL